MITIQNRPLTLAFAENSSSDIKLEIERLCRKQKQFSIKLDAYEIEIREAAVREKIKACMNQYCGLEQFETELNCIKNDCINDYKDRLHERDSFYENGFQQYFTDENKAIIMQNFSNFVNFQINEALAGKINKIFFRPVEDIFEQKVRIGMHLGNCLDKSNKLEIIASHFFKSSENGLEDKECFPKEITQTNCQILYLPLEFPILINRLVGVSFNFFENIFDVNDFKLPIKKINASRVKMSFMQILNCHHAMNDVLGSFLIQDITKLKMQNCNLNTESICIIAKKATKLQILEIDECPEILKISNVKSYFGSSLVELPNLKSLKVTNCNHLGYIGIKVKSLELDSFLSNNPKLKKIEIVSMQKPNEEQEDFACFNKKFLSV